MRALGFALTLLLAANAWAETPVARRVLGLYDSKNEQAIRFSVLHQLAEMPLNWLGLMLDYVDVRQGLPAVETLGPDVRGAVIWFVANHSPDPRGLIEWGEKFIDSGRKLVVMGESGLTMDGEGRLVPLGRKNKLLARLGVRAENENTYLTYSSRIVGMDVRFFEFERQLTGVLPAYDRYRKIDPRARSILVVRRGGDSATDSHLGVIAPNGAIIAPGYTHYANPETLRRQWYVNPFELFAEVFGTDDLPKPDVTTLSGRRIYFSHVDADGWHNVSTVPPHNKSGLTSSEVLLKEILLRYHDLPTTIGPIAAEIDPAWHGTKESDRVARAILALPHVEAGSHTFTHPFFWKFFENYTAEKEEAFRGAYRKTYRNAFKEGSLDGAAGVAALASAGRYAAPRAYGDKPFDLDHEIGGSIDAIRRFLPAGKRVALFQWSGDTEPFAAAMRRAREAGVCSMNGGDSRFDAQYPSHTSVPPLGIAVGGERQIYAANSNENTYTDLWTANFFGYRDLIWTIRNTETPRRLKPINVYYHAYSGEKLASLNALRANLDFAREQEIAPIEASRYCRMAESFYRARIVALGEERFRIEDRGDIQTIRFAKGTERRVDFVRSTGVIGQRLHQGELYVALDEAADRPVVALARRASVEDVAPEARRPYLLDARWRIFALNERGDAFSFKAQGYGEGSMAWRVRRHGRYRVEAKRAGEASEPMLVSTDEGGVLRFVLAESAVDGLDVAVAPAP
jgi:hypothetical protein